jgi:predicted membrane metal-binding protein
MATLAVLFCYLIISGAAIPTERAFVMNGIIFAAILLDRLRLSMRICALAALVVLALDPASLVGVSFQMSFGCGCGAGRGVRDLGHPPRAAVPPRLLHPQGARLLRRGGG